ncbi:MAG: hypothetical protein U1E83_10145 [Methylotetracoccus sp.]
MLDNIGDGRIKLYLIWRALELRKAWTDTFERGDYLPLRVRGEHVRHVCAYARRSKPCTIITAVPRLSAILSTDRAMLPMGKPVWGDTAIELPPDLARKQWWNALTGQSHSPAPSFELGQLFGDLPIALLTSAAPPGYPCPGIRAENDAMNGFETGR